METTAVLKKCIQNQPNFLFGRVGPVRVKKTSYERYDAIAFFNNKSRLPVSSGTVRSPKFPEKRWLDERRMAAEEESLQAYRKGRSNNEGNSKRKQPDSTSYCNFTKSAKANI